MASAPASPAKLAQDSINVVVQEKRDVATRITAVEEEIKVAEGDVAKYEAAGDAEGVAYARRKVEALRDEKKDLRDKEKRLDARLLLLEARLEAQMRSKMKGTSEGMPGSAGLMKSLSQLVEAGKELAKSAEKVLPNVIEKMKDAFPAHSSTAVTMQDANYAFRWYMRTVRLPGSSTRAWLAKRNVKLGDPLPGAHETSSLLYCFDNEVPGVFKVLADDEVDGYKAVVPLLNKHGSVAHNLVPFTISKTKVVEEEEEGIAASAAGEVTSESGAPSPSGSGMSSATDEETRWAVVMPLYPAILQQHPDITGEPLAKVWRDISDALRHLHSANLTHSDVKPANIFMDAGGGFWLGDFGSVCAPGTKNIASTAAFAPFDLPNADASFERDVWMLAVSLLETTEGCTLNRESYEKSKCNGIAPVRSVLDGHMKALQLGETSLRDHVYGWLEELAAGDV